MLHILGQILHIANFTGIPIKSKDTAHATLFNAYTFDTLLEKPVIAGFELLCFRFKPISPKIMYGKTDLLQQRGGFNN